MSVMNSICAHINPGEASKRHWNEVRWDLSSSGARTRQPSNCLSDGLVGDLETPPYRGVVQAKLLQLQAFPGYLLIDWCRGRF